MNRYSWVCFRASTPPHPARLRNGAQTGMGGGEAPGWPRSGGCWARGAAGRAGGACVHLTLPQPPSYLGSGITSPQLQGRKPSRTAPFSQPEPPAHGLDPATALTPTPWEADAGQPPRATHHPDGNKANEGLPETRPQRGGWPPWQGRQAPRRAACDALSPPTKVNKLCTRRQRNPRAAGRGRPGAGGSSRAPSGTAPLSGHGRDAPRRPPLSRTHHGIFFQLHFFHISPQISRCPPPPPPPPQRAQQYV